MEGSKYPGKFVCDWSGPYKNYPSTAIYESKTGVYTLYGCNSKFRIECEIPEFLIQQLNAMTSTLESFKSDASEEYEQCYYTRNETVNKIHDYIRDGKKIFKNVNNNWIEWE